jgi:hypothetical protein
MQLGCSGSATSARAVVVLTPKWDQRFESGFLQQRVMSEPSAARLIGRILLRATALEDLDEPGRSSKVDLSFARDRSFESISLQRGVRCELTNSALPVMMTSALGLLGNLCKSQLQLWYNVWRVDCCIGSGG